MSGPVSAVRADRFATAWMVFALVLLALGLALRGVVPQPLWTLVHVVTLGVLTNGILQWSWYFARTLLHLPPSDRRAGLANVVRAIAFNVVLIGLFAAMWIGSATWAATCAGLVGLVIAWHGWDLAVSARRALAARFAVVIRYYVTASGFLVLGCVLAGFVATAMLARHPSAWLTASRDSLTLAHALANLAGWIGLSMAGTLVTLGPTMLRTRLAPTAEKAARRSLPWMAGGVLLAVTAAIVRWMPGIGVGLLVFAGALVMGVLVPFVRSAVSHLPHSVATWTLIAGASWTMICLLAVVVHAFLARDATALRTADLAWLPLLGGGGLAQIFVAALTYLMPVVVGGGPAARRRGMGALELAWPVRVGFRNAALLLLALGAGTGAGPRSLWWAFVLVSYGVDVALFAVSGLRQVRARDAARVEGESR